MLHKNKTLKKILYSFLGLITFLICFVIWERFIRVEKMERWIIENLWEWESGADVSSLSIMSSDRYEIKNMHIYFHDGKECIVIWAYRNTMIVQDPASKKYGFYDRFRGSDRWHEIW